MIPIKNRLLANLAPALLLFSIMASPVAAISVTPPSFTDLVDRSDTIVQATVAEIHSNWVTNDKGFEVIKTFVRLRIEETAKGTGQNEITLSFFGGTVDGQTMAIAGMPEFRKGQRGWFFIKDNGRVICPLIYAHHGAYLIAPTDGSSLSRITRLNGTPLRSMEEIGDHEIDPADLASLDLESAMSSRDFGEAVSREYTRLQTNRLREP